MADEIKIETNINPIKKVLNIFSHERIKDQLLKEVDNIVYKTYPGEHLINDITDLMKEELSEPYPIFTYRYFLNECPDCCIMAYDKSEGDKFIGCIIGNCEKSKKSTKKKGYIAMIAVNKLYRGKGIGKRLCEIFIQQLKDVYKAHEIYLETEVTNLLALSLYQGFGFARTKKLYNYYLNGNSAFRLKLWLMEFVNAKEEENS
jgi:peptide alpha-N-acetyltransferase